MRCRYCKTVKDLYFSEARKLKNGSTTNYYICRSCNTAKVKKYRTSENGKEAVKRATCKYDSKNPERRKAWSKAAALPKKPCETCGDTVVDKHHPDYSNPLEVVYLCRVHHKQVHKMV